MQWFMALNDWMMKSYWDCIRVAVTTAPQELEPHFVFDGPERPELAWLRGRGVKVHHHRVTFHDELVKYYTKQRKPGDVVDRAKAAPGMFLRCEIPLVCDSPFAFYTDVDVMFTGKPLGLDAYRPEILAAAPQFERTNWEYFNSGVMVLNVTNLRRLLPGLLKHLTATNCDQTALFGLAAGRWSRLDPTYNWKAYWPVNDNAKVIHFHGPKPTKKAEVHEFPEVLEPLRTASFFEHQKKWLAIRDGLSDELPDAEPAGVPYADIPTAMTIAEGKALASLAKGRRVLELGSQYGYSTVTMARTAEAIHAVDAHVGDEHAGYSNSLPELWNNLVRYGVASKVVVHAGRFADVLPLLLPGSFNMILIDGLHTKEAVERDIGLAKPLAASDAVWALHDYGRFPGVVAAADSLLGKPTERVDTLAIYRKA